MLNAIPTAILLLLLNWYFKVMLFGPLDRVLKQREDLTEGARKSADESLAAAERKHREFEKKLNDAKAEVYRAQEEMRRKWLEDQAEHVDLARKGSEQTVHEARQQIEAEASAARGNLAATTATLADEIATTILARKSGGGR
jgi:F-type H+-transporting ATPase subunit b